MKSIVQNETLKPAVDGMSTKKKLCDRVASDIVSNSLIGELFLKLHLLIQILVPFIITGFSDWKT